MKIWKFYLILMVTALVVFSPLLKGEEKEPPFNTLKLVKTLPAEKEEDVYFKFPAVIEVDDKGFIYAFDPNSHHFIYKMDPEGNLVKKIGRQGRGPGDLYRPRLMKIYEGKLFIVDRYGFAIFNLDGKFLHRFRLFNSLRVFDVGGDKIFAIEEGTEKLITVYDFQGKRLFEFGKKYPLLSTLRTKRHRISFDGSIHNGDIFCCEDCVLFISNLFGDIHKYDYLGNLIGQYTIPEFSAADNEIIRRNKENFFEKGFKGQGGIRSFLIYVDIDYYDGRLYILDLAKKLYDRVITVDLATMAIVDNSRFHFKAPTGKTDITSQRLLVKDIGGQRSYYVSLLKEPDKEVFLKKYR